MGPLYEVWLDAFKVWAPLWSMTVWLDSFKVWAPFMKYDLMSLRRGLLNIIPMLMILRRGPPFTLKVKEFKAWAPLLLYKLMVLRHGLLFIKHDLMPLKSGPPTRQVSILHYSGWLFYHFPYDQLRRSNNFIGMHGNSFIMSTLIIPPVPGHPSKNL